MADRSGNIKRLFAPRSVAFVGGNSAELAARQCVAGGFEGSLWGVNPKRRRMAGRPCVASVAAQNENRSLDIGAPFRPLPRLAHPTPARDVPVK